MGYSRSALPAIGWSLTTKTCDHNPATMSTYGMDSHDLTLLACCVEVEPWDLAVVRLRGRDGCGGSSRTRSWPGLCGAAAGDSSVPLVATVRHREGQCVVIPRESVSEFVRRQQHDAGAALTSQGSGSGDEAEEEASWAALRLPTAGPVGAVFSIIAAAGLEALVLAAPLIGKPRVLVRTISLVAVASALVAMGFAVGPATRLCPAPPPGLGRKNEEVDTSAVASAGVWTRAEPDEVYDEGNRIDDMWPGGHAPPYAVRFDSGTGIFVDIRIPTSSDASSARSLEASCAGICRPHLDGSAARRHGVVGLQPRAPGEPRLDEDMASWEQLASGNSMTLELASPAGLRCGYWLFAGGLFARVVGPPLGEGLAGHYCCKDVAQLRRLRGDAVDIELRTQYEAILGKVERPGLLRVLRSSSTPAAVGTLLYDAVSLEEGSIEVDVEVGLVVHRFPGGAEQRWRIVRMVDDPFTPTGRPPMESDVTVIGVQSSDGCHNSSRASTTWSVDPPQMNGTVDNAGKVPDRSKAERGQKDQRQDFSRSPSLILFDNVPRVARGPAHNRSVSSYEKVLRNKDASSSRSRSKQKDQENGKRRKDSRSHSAKERKERERSRSRSRSRRREREMKKEKDRARDRGREKHNRETYHERDRAKGREREKDWDRDKKHNREKDKEKGNGADSERRRRNDNRSRSGCRDDEKRRRKSCSRSRRPEINRSCPCTRSRDREREKERPRLWSRDREREKERPRSRSRDREREREKEREKEKAKARQSRSRSPKGKSSRGGFDQREPQEDGVAIAAASTLTLAIKQQPSPMQLLDLPATASGYATLTPEVEAFISQNPVEPHAAQRLRSLPPDMQRLVIERGSLFGARDPSAVLLSRVRDAMVGGVQGMGLGIPAPPPMNILGMHPGVETLISRYSLDARCAQMLRSLNPDKQALAAELPVHEARNPSAFVMAQLQLPHFTRAVPQSVLSLLGAPPGHPQLTAPQVAQSNQQTSMFQVV